MAFKLWKQILEKENEKIDGDYTFTICDWVLGNSYWVKNNVAPDIQYMPYWKKS